MKRIRASAIATLSFLLKISITAVSFYWRKDTPNFCNLSLLVCHDVIEGGVRILISISYKWNWKKVYDICSDYRFRAILK